MATETLRPTANINPYGSGLGPFSSPAQAYDGNTSTAASAAESVGGSGPGGGSVQDGMTILTWQPPSNQSVYTGLTLNVLYSAAASSSVNGSSSSASSQWAIFYSVDGGNTWTSLAGGSFNQALTTASIALPVNTNLANLQIQAFISASWGAAPGQSANASASLNIFEINTQGTYPGTVLVPVSGVSAAFAENNPGAQGNTNANVSILGVAALFAEHNPVSQGQTTVSVTITGVFSFFQVGQVGIVSQEGATVTVTGLSAFFFSFGGTTFVTVDAVTVQPYTALYKNAINPENIGEGVVNLEGRTALTLDFFDGDGVYSRDIEAVISWPVTSGRIIRSWQPSLIPMPETVFDRPGDWVDGGTPGAKFIQGIIVDADTMGAGKTFGLQASDDLVIRPLLECPAVFVKRTQKAFSCVPFLAHSVRRYSTDGVQWRVWNEQLVFTPYPELTMNWTCAPSALGLVGWGHLREMNIAYISTANLSLTLSFDAWPVITIVIPPSGGVIKKVKFPLPVNKFKLVQPSVTSTAPFRLFAPEIEVKLGQWGRSDSYKVLKPFGGPNQAEALV